MPQSLAVLYVHLVFSTRDRVPFLTDETLRNDLHAYLGGISNKLGCPPVVIGGTADHVHLLGRQGKQMPLANWIRDLKANSTTWIKRRAPDLPAFGWQSGYGAFSVDTTRIEVVRQYILNQEEHHKTFSYQDELRALLKESGIQPTEAHLWD